MAACASAVGAAAVVCVTPVDIHTQSRTSVSLSKGLTLAASPSKRFSSKLVTKNKSRVTMRYGYCFVGFFYPSLLGHSAAMAFGWSVIGVLYTLSFLLQLNGSDVRQKNWRRFIAAVKLPLLTLLIKSIVTCFCVQCLTEGAWCYQSHRVSFVGGCCGSGACWSCTTWH